METTACRSPHARSARLGAGWAIHLALGLAALVAAAHAAPDGPAIAEPARERVAPRPAAAPPAPPLLRLEPEAPAKPAVTAGHGKEMATLVAFRFTNTAFEAALGQIEREAGVHMDIDWEAMASMDVDRNQEVTFAVPQGPASKALDLLLEKIKPEKPCPLAWASIEGSVRVASRVAIDQATSVLRHHDASDLLRWPANVGSPVLALRQVRSDADMDPGSGDGSFLSPRAGALLQAVTESESPDAWNINGGEPYTIALNGGQLTIKAPARVHAAVERMLQSLRAGDQEANVALLRMLDRRVTIECEDIKAGEFFAQLRRCADVNVNVNWRQLEKLGVGKDSVIDASFRNVRLRTVLELSVHNLHPDLVIKVYDGVLAVHVPEAEPPPRAPMPGIPGEGEPVPGVVPVPVPAEKAEPEAPAPAPDAVPAPPVPAPPAVPAPAVGENSRAPRPRN